MYIVYPLPKQQCLCDVASVYSKEFIPEIKKLLRINKKVFFYLL